MSEVSIKPPPLPDDPFAEGKLATVGIRLPSSAWKSSIGRYELLTRTETSRSVEDAEKYKALNTLVRLGVLVPVNQLDTYHGRVGSKDDTWTVDPAFANHGNATGNANVNERSTLYTADEHTAKDFALVRAKRLTPSSYYKLFEGHVRNYTAEQRQEWFERLNREMREIWERQSPEVRKFYNSDGQPRLYKISELENDSIIRAEARSLAQQAFARDRAEIHEVVSPDKDATAIDLGFDATKLNEEDKTKYYEALRAIAIPVTEGSPVDFGSRDAVQKFVHVFNQLNYQFDYILPNVIGNIALNAGISEDTARQLAGAFNARQIVLSDPIYLVNKFLYNGETIITGKVSINGKLEEVPINLEYIERYLHGAHIVAAKQVVDSASLNRGITIVSFVDLEKIGTQEQIATQKRRMQQIMGSLVDTFPQLPKIESAGDTRKLLIELEDAHAKPERLIEAAKQIGEFGKIYESDAGNWEGYTLGEHTETVLRNFDENFADVLPVEYLAPMRLAILAHDLGKPLAVARGEKHRQKEYNAFQARNFLRSVGVEPHFIDFLTAIITDGSDLAFKLQTHPNNAATNTQIEIFTEDVVKKYLKTPIIDDSQIKAFIEMCKIFQLSDGGAYTSMAITRRGGLGHFRNAPSFNNSFAVPTGLGKRDIKYPNK